MIHYGFYFRSSQSTQLNSTYIDHDYHEASHGDNQYGDDNPLYEYGGTTEAQIYHFSSTLSQMVSWSWWHRCQDLQSWSVSGLAWNHEMVKVWAARQKGVGEAKVEPWSTHYTTWHHQPKPITSKLNQFVLICIEDWGFLSGVEVSPLKNVAMVCLFKTHSGEKSNNVEKVSF